MGRVTRRFVIAGSLVCAIAALCGFGYWSTPARARSAQAMIKPIVAQFVPSPAAVFHKDQLSVLVLGIDYNYDDRDQPFSAGARSDTIMAVSLDLAHKTVRELSIPRDMDVVLPNGSEDKINAAYSDGGPREAEAVIARFLGIPKFDRYVVLRVNAAADLIDALGGVDVDVKNSDALRHAGPNGPVDYDDSWGHLHVHLKPGMQTLTGPQAVGYARFRHDWCSDPCRIMRQQQVARAVVDRVEHHQFNTFLRLQSLLGVARRDVQTDLDGREELSLATEFSDVDLASIRMDQIPYVADKELPGVGDVILPDEAAKAKLVAALFAPPAAAADKAPQGDPVFDMLSAGSHAQDQRPEVVSVESLAP